MCIIAVCKTRKLNHEEFSNCYSSNSDGAGIGWRTDEGKVEYVKGFMKQKDAWKFYRTVDKLPHVIHFRIGTSGTIEEKLCHPFLISPTPKNPVFYSGKLPVIFHNGIILNWANMLTTLVCAGIRVPYPYNDTMVLAYTIAQYIKAGTRYAPILDTVGGKYAIITPEKIYIHGAFEKEDGVLFSNNGYKYYTYRTNNDRDEFFDNHSRWPDTAYSKEVKKILDEIEDIEPKLETVEEDNKDLPTVAPQQNRASTETDKDGTVKITLTEENGKKTEYTFPPKNKKDEKDYLTRGV